MIVAIQIEKTGGKANFGIFTKLKFITFTYHKYLINTKTQLQ